LPGGVAQQVVVNVTLSAQTAHTGYAGGALAANNPVTLEIAGNAGTDQVNIAGGTSVAGIIGAINNLKGTTGTSASLSGVNLRLDSTGFGSDQYVTIKAISGVFVPTAARATGRDAAVTINNQVAAVKGTTVSLTNSNLDTSFTLGSAFNVVGASTFNVIGGGANFSVGSRVTDNNRISIGIGNIAAGSLGDAVNGFISSLGTGGANSISSLSSATAAKGQSIINSAVKQIATLNGRLGNFLNYTLGETSTALQSTLTNVAAAQSNIRDANFATETANLTRAQILQASATSVLATANAQQQSVLKLLA
jgi:flagellin